MRTHEFLMWLGKMCTDLKISVKRKRIKEVFDLFIKGNKLMPQY